MSLGCMIDGCPYEDEVLCSNSGTKIYMAKLNPALGTPVCEHCLKKAVGVPPPPDFKPVYDHATDTWGWGKWSGKDDATAPVWNLGGITGCSFETLQGQAKRGRVLLERY